MSIQAPKGTRDVLPHDSYKWQYIEQKMRETAKEFGYREIRTPVFEHTELFLRGIGDSTDVVKKEMYTFLDKKGRSITLKPEGTAGAARAFLEAGLHVGALPAKLYYMYCPAFRYEKPQAGRLREHHQFGIECYGAKDATADAEMISLAYLLFTKLGITELALNINSIGCPNCRPNYNQKLKEFYKDKLEGMCQDCKERYENNPLRLLDCKVPCCKEAAIGVPSMIEFLCPECNEHFEQLKNCLNIMQIPFEIDSKIVRGLDYYSKTVFEFISTAIGSQGTVCGGGRYDGLMEQLDGPKLAGVGFGMGMERLLLVLDSCNLLPEALPQYDAYFVTMGKNAHNMGIKLCYNLRAQGVACEVDNMQRTPKAQFKYADKLKVKYCVIIGDDEIAKNMATVKNMQTGEQTEIEFEALANYIKN